MVAGRNAITPPEPAMTSPGKEPQTEECLRLDLRMQPPPGSRRRAWERALLVTVVLAVVLAGAQLLDHRTPALAKSGPPDHAMHVCLNAIYDTIDLGSPLALITDEVCPSLPLHLRYVSGTERQHVAFEQCMADHGCPVVATQYESARHR